MSEPASIPVIVTDDEKTFAALAHALQLVGWWIAPLVIFAVKRQSKFVSFHALQALLLQCILAVLWVGAMIVWFALFFGTLFRNGVPQQNAPPPAGFFIFIPLIWLLGMGFWVTVMVLSILYAIKAGRGEWAAYPVIGNWAKRILKV